MVAEQVGGKVVDVQIWQAVGSDIAALPPIKTFSQAKDIVGLRSTHSGERNFLS